AGVRTCVAGSAVQRVAVSVPRAPAGGSGPGPAIGGGAAGAGAARRSSRDSRSVSPPSQPARVGRGLAHLRFLSEGQSGRSGCGELRRGRAAGRGSQIALGAATVIATLARRRRSATLSAGRTPPACGVRAAPLPEGVA